MEGKNYCLVKVRAGSVQGRRKQCDCLVPPRRQIIFQIYVKIFEVNFADARVGLRGSLCGFFFLDKLAAATVSLRVLFGFHLSQ
jgi:hypothetical protein